MSALGSETPEDKANKVTLARQLSRKNLESGGYSDKIETEKKKGGKAKLPGWKHFLAGGVAGACEVIGTMPLDVVKTQMQINPGKYRNPFHAMAGIASTSGFKGLYYGMPAFLVQTSGKAGIRFTAFAKCKEGIVGLLGEEGANNNKTMVDLGAGLGAGAVEAALWTTPTERLKVLRQSEASGGNKYASTLGTLRTVIAEGGVSSLFVGLVPCVLRQASSVGFRFMCYPIVKRNIDSVTTDSNLPDALVHMISGGTVGALSVIINNPVDIIKNIQQAGKSNKGTIGVAIDVMKESGPSGFFRGLTARVPRVFCGQAITFAVYEQMAVILLKV